jgi:hypothetical protein
MVDLLVGTIKLVCESFYQDKRKGTSPTFNPTLGSISAAMNFVNSNLTGSLQFFSLYT